MTAEDIRKTMGPMLGIIVDDETARAAPMLPFLVTATIMIAEIAAQLAELQEPLRAFVDDLNAYRNERIVKRGGVG